MRVPTIAGLLMVFLILAAQYEKWTLPFSVLLAMPFGLFGLHEGNTHRFSVPTGCPLASLKVRIEWGNFAEDLDL